MSDPDLDPILHALKSLDFRIRLLQTTKVNLDECIQYVRDGFDKLRDALQEERKDAPLGQPIQRVS